MLPNSPVRLARTVEFFSDSIDQLCDERCKKVILSPSGNQRNIRTIHDALRTQKDSDIVRADYTSEGKPVMIFAPKGRKLTNEGMSDVNGRRQREELSQILWKTAETANRKFKYLTAEQGSVIFQLKLASRSIPVARDFKVGDIRPYFARLNGAYGRSVTTAWQEKEIDPYRERSSHRQKIKIQRAKQFLKMEPATRLSLINALSRPEDKGPELVIAAVRAMDDFLRNFLDPKEPYREMVRKVHDNTELLFFCQRWVKMHPLSNKKGAVYRDYHKFEPHSWSRLLDVLCRLIIKETRRQTVLVAEGDTRVRKNSVIFRRTLHGQHTEPNLVGRQARVEGNVRPHVFVVDNMALPIEPEFKARAIPTDDGLRSYAYTVDTTALPTEPQFIARFVEQ